MKDVKKMKIAFPSHLWRRLESCPENGRYIEKRFVKTSFSGKKIEIIIYVLFVVSLVLITTVLEISTSKDGLTAIVGAGVGVGVTTTVLMIATPCWFSTYVCTAVTPGVGAGAGNVWTCVHPAISIVETITSRTRNTVVFFIISPSFIALTGNENHAEEVINLFNLTCSEFSKGTLNGAGKNFFNSA